MKQYMIFKKVFTFLFAFVICTNASFSTTNNTGSNLIVNSFQQHSSDQNYDFNESKGVARASFRGYGKRGRGRGRGFNSGRGRGLSNWPHSSRGSRGRGVYNSYGNNFNIGGTQSKNNYTSKDFNKLSGRDSYSGAFLFNGDEIYPKELYNRFGNVKYNNIDSFFCDKSVNFENRWNAQFLSSKEVKDKTSDVADMNFYVSEVDYHLLIKNGQQNAKLFYKTSLDKYIPQSNNKSYKVETTVCIDGVRKSWGKDENCNDIFWKDEESICGLTFNANIDTFFFNKLSSNIKIGFSLHAKNKSLLNGRRHFKRNRILVLSVISDNTSELTNTINEPFKKRAEATIFNILPIEEATTKEDSCKKNVKDGSNNKENGKNMEHTDVKSLSKNKNTCPIPNDENDEEPDFYGEEE